MRNTYPQENIHNSYFDTSYTEKQTLNHCAYDCIRHIQEIYNQIVEKQQLYSQSHLSKVRSNTSIQDPMSKTCYAFNFNSNQVLDKFSKTSNQHQNFHYTNNCEQASNFSFYSHKEILQEEQDFLTSSLANLQQEKHLKIMELIGRILFKQEYSSRKQITEIKESYQTELKNLQQNYNSHKQLLKDYMQQNQFLKDQLTQQRSEKTQIQHKLNQSQQQIIATKQFVKHQEYSKEKLSQKVQKFQYVIQELQNNLTKTQKQLQRNQTLNKAQIQQIKKLVRERKEYFNEVKNYQQANELLTLQTKKLLQQIEQLKICLSEKQNYVNYLENSNSNFKKSMYSQNQNQNIQNFQNSSKKYIKVKKFDTVIQQKSEQLSDIDQKSKSSQRVKEKVLRSQRDWNVEQIYCLKDLNFFEHSHPNQKKQNSQDCSFESLSSSKKNKIFETNKQEYFYFSKSNESDRRMSFGNGKDKILQLRNSSKGTNSLEKVMQANIKPNILIRDMSQFQKNNKKSVRSYQKIKSQIFLDKQSNSKHPGIYQPKKLNFINQKESSEKQPYAPATQNISGKRRINNEKFSNKQQSNNKMSSQYIKNPLQNFLALEESYKQFQEILNEDQSKESKYQSFQKKKKSFQNNFHDKKRQKQLLYQIQILKGQLINKCERLFQIQGENQQILEELTDKINFQKIQLKKLSQKCIILNSENQVYRYQNQDLKQNLEQLQVQIKDLNELYFTSIQDSKILKEMMTQAESASNLRVQKVKQFCKRHLLTVTEQFEESLKMLKEQLIQYESLSKKLKQPQILMKAKLLLQNFSQTQGYKLTLQLQVFDFKLQNLRIKNTINSHQILASKQKTDQQTYKFQSTNKKIKDNQNQNIFELSSLQLNEPQSFNQQSKSRIQLQQSQNQFKEKPIQNYSLNLCQRQNQFFNQKSFSFLSKMQKRNLIQSFLDNDNQTKRNKLSKIGFTTYQDQSQIRLFKYQILQKLYILSAKPQYHGYKKNNKDDNQSQNLHFFITNNKIINLTNNQILKSRQPIVVKDFNMLILGNCELLIQKGCLIITRNKKKCHFKGDICDGNWKINKIYEDKRKAVLQQKRREDIISRSEKQKFLIQFLLFYRLTY